ncbi:hypothetical protein TEA_016005 [Camellia sinensis var. sinensis]|uniref:Beta-amylase n=1 Tax=Camellia sinensis var. sinensis TaxID=542762 RepID=A0A4S4DSV2_CAMSN|nr:hypothetical protein TEA_016005 [Camellia sinensis var. sinensis]
MGNEVFREISLPNYQPDGRLHTSTAVAVLGKSLAVLDCTSPQADLIASTEVEPQSLLQMDSQRESEEVKNLNLLQVMAKERIESMDKPPKLQERDFSGTAYVPVYVMLPGQLGVINMDCQLVDQDNLLNQVVMSFHECGGNVGDDVHIPLPQWLTAIGQRNPDIFFTDKKGRHNPECLTWGIDKERILRGGTAVEILHYVVLLSSQIREMKMDDDGDEGTTTTTIAIPTFAGSFPTPSAIAAEGEERPEGVVSFHVCKRGKSIVFFNETRPSCGCRVHECVIIDVGFA